MTNQQHPITPSPKLVEKWADASARTHGERGTYVQHEFTLATKAARWGADQELEACLRYAGDNGLSLSRMRAARRPNPPSLKEQALAALERYEAEEWCEEMTFDSSIIRRALEALPND
jgi:hypothetical protein